MLRRIAALWTMAAAIALAQYFPARIGVATDRVFVGEPFAVNIAASGMPSRPDTSNVRAFGVEFLRSDWKPDRAETIFRYRFRALRAGELEIPPIPIRAGDAETRTPRVKITARPASAGGAALRVVIPSGRLFVGQQLILRLIAESPAPLGSPRFDAPFLTDERFTGLIFRSGFALRPGPGEVRAFVNGTPVAASSRGASVAVEVGLIPKTAGVLDLGPASVRGRGSFAASNRVVLHVGELPSEGRPRNFTGLVGRYILEASAAPHRVRLGDPIRLDLRLSGPPYLEEARLPPLPYDNDFRVTAGQGTGGDDARVFGFTLRPRRETVSVIPAIRYSYFDPETARYVESRTEPIPIAVEPASVVTVSDAQPSTFSISPQPHAPQDLVGGIRHNYEGPDLLTSQVPYFAWVTDSPWKIGAFALPPLVCLALFGVTLRSRSTNSSARHGSTPTATSRKRRP